MNNRERKFVYKLAGYDKGIYMLELEEKIDRLEKRNKKLKQEVKRSNKIIDRARRFLDLTCYYNERTLTFSECNKLYNMLDREELKEEGNKDK